MWAKLNSARDTIEEIIVNTKQMSINEVTHPETLFTLWTDAERLDVGIVPVTTTGTHLNPSYYIEADPTYAIAGDGTFVIRTIGVKSSDRTLSDLKTIDKNAVAASAHTWLTGFAWLIERKVTANIAIPNAVITYMASIRQDCDDIQSAIDGAANVDALAGLDTDSWTSDANVKAYRR
tara:strand:+ start:2062 stop:2595 length:534 start_codon:yes stop_codon:yes gene_type:complete